MRRRPIALSRRPSIKIRVDTKDVDEFIRRINRKHKSYKTPLENIMKRLEKGTEEVFRTEGAFGGFGKWAPLDPKYEKWKNTVNEGQYSKRGMLVFSGRMRDSLTRPKAPGAIRTIGKRTMTFGTKVPYAQFHQKGAVLHHGGILPKRQMIPFSDDSIRWATEEVGDWLIPVKYRSRR